MTPRCDCVDTELAWGREGDTPWLSQSLVSECAHPDVQAALARAPTLFGSDSRPNGGVDHIEIGGQVIEIGRACPDDPSCQVPAGVYELGQLLGHVRLFEQQRGACTLK